MMKFDKINFRQPKYMFPAILYIPVLFTAYFVIDMFNFEKQEIGDPALETTTYLNDKLPEANIKGDGIGDKMTNMQRDFGKISDATAVEGVERGEESDKEVYNSQYTDEERAALERDRAEAQDALDRLRQMQEQMKQSGGGVNDGMTDDERTIIELQQALADARQQNLRLMTGGGGLAAQPVAEEEPAPVQPAPAEITVNEKAVTEISEEAQAEEVVKAGVGTSDYFNTIAENEPEHKLIRAIVDEEVKVVNGSRVRLRLLDDIEIGGRLILRGSYLYSTIGSSSQQRIKANVKSILVDDELVKVNLSVYDTDGMEGLYVPRSTFRETAQDVAGSALSQSMNINDGTSNDNFSRWGMQSLQNAYQRTANAISKSVRKKTTKIKYGTHVYLVNSREASSRNRRNTR